MRLAPKKAFDHTTAPDPRDGTQDYVATQPTLVQFVRAPEDCIWGLYAGTGHLFDGVSSAGLETRALAMVHPGGCTHARATLNYTWDGTSSAASYPQFELTTVEGGTTGNDVVTLYVPPWEGAYVPTPVFPGEMYSTTTTANKQSDTPTTPQDRLLELDESLEVRIEAVTVSYCCGVSLFVSKRTQDFESL